MEVSFILVNYNTNALLFKAIGSIFQFTDPALSFEVIVVDNASKESPAALLALQFPQVIFIQSPANMGFGAANNLAMQEAKGKYFFFLNPDAYLLSDGASFFINKMKNPAFINMAFCSYRVVIKFFFSFINAISNTKKRVAIMVQVMLLYQQKEHWNTI